MLVHELTHALQDQYYDLEKLIKQADNTDKETAIKYLVEGEATYVMTIAQLEKMGMTYQQISKTFSKHENITLEKYIILHKIERTKELLISNEYTLAKLHLLWISAVYIICQIRLKRLPVFRLVSLKKHPYFTKRVLIIF